METNTTVCVMMCGEDAEGTYDVCLAGRLVLWLLCKYLISSG